VFLAPDRRDVADLNASAGNSIQDAAWPIGVTPSRAQRVPKKFED